MSQSPIDDFSDQATLSYKQGWRALNRLLHEDRSFSGHERNCAFLNTGGDSAAFADVSAVTGFDFADDGRGLATSDWDFDGDLDVWTTNRTAPRIRLLQNTSVRQSFVAFKLQGDGIVSNRDAIGARLELHVADNSAPLRIRTLHGGEGFLSQSSNWIHFGLGSIGEIQKLVVKWPGGQAQEFTGLKAGQFYKLKQGDPAFEKFDPKDKWPERQVPSEDGAPTFLKSTPQKPQPLVETARIIVPTGLPVPDVEILAKDGKPTIHPLSKERPTLINLWSSTCASCLTELSEWSAHRKELDAAGIDVLTLSTDHLSENRTPAMTMAALAKTGSIFDNERVSSTTLQSLDELQRSVLDRWLPLPVPTTFLVSPHGELVAIYKGPVSAEQLLQDIPFATGSATDRRRASIPFPGEWVGGPSAADPRRVSSIMLDHNRVDAAINYLSKCTQHFEDLDVASTENGKRQLGDLYYSSGLLTSTKPDQYDQAVQHLTRARDLIPQDLRIRMELGRQYMTRNDLRSALPEFTAAAEINPSDSGLRQDVGVIHFTLGDYPKAKQFLAPIVVEAPKNGLAQYHLANTEVRLGNLPAAIEGYRKTLTSAPKLIDAANNLAWILASHPDENLRSPEEALALATQLCSITKEKEPRYLDSLSVAQANTGEFEAAIASAEKAIGLYGNNPAAKEPLQARLALYRTGKPYREAAWQK